MPIITPTAPAQNSSYNVTESTLATLRAELERGDRICREHDSSLKAVGGCVDGSGQGTSEDVEGGGGENIGGGRVSPSSSAEAMDGPGPGPGAAAGDGSTLWSSLLEPSPFFNDNKHFLVVEVMTTAGGASGGHHLWVGWIESRLRWLVLAVEKVSRGNILVHPWPHPHETVTKPWAGQVSGVGRTTTYFIGLRSKAGEGGGGGGRGAALPLSQGIVNQGLFPAAGAGGGRSVPGGGGVNLQGAVDEFLSIVNSWPGRVEGMKCVVRYQKAPPSSVQPVLRSSSGGTPAPTFSSVAAAEAGVPHVGDKRKGRKGSPEGHGVQAPKYN